MYHFPWWKEVRNQIPEDLGKWEQSSKTSKKDWMWQRGITSHPLSEDPWKKSHLTVWRWESETPKSWAFQSKVSGPTLPPMVFCWEYQASGARAAGRWCSSITMVRRSRCTGCTRRWMQSMKFSVTSEGLSYRLPCVSSGKLLVLRWCTLTTKALLTVCGEVR